MLRRRSVLLGLPALAACAPTTQLARRPASGFNGPRLEDDRFVSFDGARLGLTVWPASTGVWRPSEKRTSSSATKTFTKRRRAPASSKRRAAKPGWAASSDLRTSPTVAPSTSTSAAPPARVRSWVGMRTVAISERGP